LHQMEGIYPLVIAVLLCWLSVISACLIDFWSGVTTARALGEPLASHGFRRTMIKIGDYVRVMLFALMFDLLGSLFECYALPYATMISAAAVLLIEGYSVRENSTRGRSGAEKMARIAEVAAKAAAKRAGLPGIVEQIGQIVEDRD
ncbi:MAG: hypothetical protein SNF60_04680, partial [Rikenellaceae bacterium]